MNNCLNMFTAVCLMSASLFAAAPNQDSKLTPEERAAKRAEMQQKMLKHTGGFVMRPGTQQGEIVYVNCQTAADEKWLNDSAKYFAEQTKYKVSVKKGSFDFKNPKIEGSLSIFIVDDATLPSLLIAPEGRWALVNVSTLKSGNGEKPAFFEARTRKELNRAFAYLCGAVVSRYPGSAITGVTKPEDLDQVTELRLPLDLFQRFDGYVSAFGIKPAEKVTYLKACQQGWAPAPTNEFQKAVWDKVHAAPSNPIKIKFDPKTDGKDKE